MRFARCDFCKKECNLDDVREYYNARTDPGAKIVVEFKPAGDMCQDCAEAVCQAITATLALRAEKD